MRDVIRSRKSGSSVGDIEDAKSRFLWRVLVRVEKLKDLEKVIIQRKVYLKDVASVRLDHFEKPELFCAYEHRNLGLLVCSEIGSNVIEIKSARESSLCNQAPKVCSNNVTAVGLSERLKSFRMS